MAVAPLIEERGARGLTMRAAAAAAHLSLGGLAHYFPTKRDLLLHPLGPEAFDRLCQDFHRRHGPLKATDPEAYLEAYTEWQVQECAFIRPALWASLELGVPVFREAIQRGIESGLRDFAAPLQVLAPGLAPDGIDELARSIRRLLFGSLLDRQVTPGALRRELTALIRGHREVATA